MSMKLRKNLGRLATAFVATAMLASVAAVPASAADYVAGKTNPSFTKTIDMSQAEGATVPNATYTYSIDKGAAVPAGADSPEIKEGVVVETGEGDNRKVTAPAITESVAFVPTDTIVSNKVAKTVTVDFSNITFAQPGIYRYVITENDPEVKGLTTDGPSTLYLDVYVIDDNGTNKISDYVMLTDAITPTLDEDKTNAIYGDQKAKFSGNDDDTYQTYELTVKKIVDGKMGDKSVSYSFTINFSNLSNGIKVSTKTTTQAGEGKPTMSYTPSPAASDGKTQVSKDLMSEEEVTIYGVPADAVYEVVETLSKNSSYTVTYKIDDAQDASNMTSSDGENNTTKYTTGGQNVTPVDSNASDHKVVVTNFKEAVVPTGIVMNVAPYALLVVVAAGACFVFLRKRRED